VARPAAIGLTSALALAFNLSFNLLLIPRFGITGAAVVSAVSYWIAALLIVLLTSRVMGRTARSIFRVSKPNLASLRALAHVETGNGK
jgi:Na+-driven multidrug efflux pump